MMRSLATAVCAAIISGCAAPSSPRAVLAEPCVAMALWSNGWHTDIAMPAHALPPDHPARRLAPDARYFLFGWGERAFYRSDGGDVLLAIDAALPPSPSALQIVASDAPAERVFQAKETPAFGVTDEGARRMAAFIAASMLLDAEGDARVIGPGHAPDRSWFVEGREGFHLFHMCNRWTARALAAGGLEVRGGFGWSADAIVRQVKSQPVCLPKEASPGGESLP